MSAVWPASIRPIDEPLVWMVTRGVLFGKGEGRRREDKRGCGRNEKGEEREHLRVQNSNDVKSRAGTKSPC